MADGIKSMLDEAAQRRLAQNRSFGLSFPSPQFRTEPITRDLAAGLGGLTQSIAARKDEMAAQQAALRKMVAEQQHDIGLEWIKQGYVQDPETGAYVPTPSTQAEMDLKAQQQAKAEAESAEQKRLTELLSGTNQVPVGNGLVLDKKTGRVFAPPRTTYSYRSGGGGSGGDVDYSMPKNIVDAASGTVALDRFRSRYDLTDREFVRNPIAIRAVSGIIRVGQGLANGSVRNKEDAVRAVEEIVDVMRLRKEPGKAEALRTDGLALVGEIVAGQEAAADWVERRERGKGGVIEELSNDAPTVYSDDDYDRFLAEGD